MIRVLRELRFLPGRLPLFVGIGLGLLCAARAGAGIRTVTFDFEDQAVTSNGALTSLTLSRSNLSIEIDRVGQPFDVANLSALNGASEFGSRSLAPTPPGGNFFNVNFSKPAAYFSAQLGDFTGQGTDSLAMTAFSGHNGTGTNLGTSFASLPLNADGMFAFKTLQISGRNIESVQLTGGTAGATNSVYFDNFHITADMSGAGKGGISAVPLPPGVYVMPFCAAIAWAAGRRLRAGNSGQTRSNRNPATGAKFRRRARALHARSMRGWDKPHLGDL